MIGVEVIPFFILFLVLLGLLFLFLCFLLLLLLKIEAICSIEVVPIRLSYKIIHRLKTNLPLHPYTHKSLDQIGTLSAYLIHFSLHSFDSPHLPPVD